MPRLIAVGDVHGHRKTLDKILERVVPASDDTLVFVGDYVDKGPDSKGVIDRILELRNSEINCVCLMGNHESALLEILGFARSRKPGIILGGHDLLLFRQNGLPATAKSYGWPCDDQTTMIGTHNTWRMPGAHLEFLLHLDTHLLIGNLLFVHAHLDHAALKLTTAAEAVQDQLENNPSALMRERDSFFAEKAFPELLVHGHTPVHTVEIEPNSETRRPIGEIKIVRGRLNIDTSMASHKILSAVQLSLAGEIEEIWQEQDCDCR